MPTNAELTASLAEATARAEKAEKRVETLKSDLVIVKERVDAEIKARQGVEAAIDAARTEISSLTKSLKAYKGSATKARNEVTVLKRERSPQARPIGAPKPVKTPEHAAARAAELDAAFADGPVELVFSDGKREIRELAPLIAAADAFRATPRGRVLNFEPMLEIEGARVSVTVRGVGLLTEAGEQAGYCRLIEPVTVPAGQKVLIPAGSIRF